MQTVLRYLPSAPYIARSLIRAAMACAAYAAGYPAVGHILLVLATISLLGSIEIAIAKDVSEAFSRAWRLRKALQRCTICDGQGQDLSAEHACDDNCCTDCFGAGVKSAPATFKKSEIRGLVTYLLTDKFAERENKNLCQGTRLRLLRNRIMSPALTY
jgi:hypothetical protein